MDVAPWCIDGRDWISPEHITVLKNSLLGDLLKSISKMDNAVSGFLFGTETYLL